MKRQAYILTIAFILILTACGAHLKHIVASVPDRAFVMGASERQAVVQPRTSGTMSFADIISWFAYELISTVTESDDHDITAHASNVEGDQGLDQSGNSAERSPTTDPYGLRARATFRSPTLPSALDPQR